MATSGFGWSPAALPSRSLFNLQDIEHLAHLRHHINSLLLLSGNRLPESWTSPRITERLSREADVERGQEARKLETCRLGRVNVACFHAVALSINRQ
jgi:hypothetical protein